MAYNKKSLENLRQFKKGQSGNPAGRPPDAMKQIKSIPKDAQAKIYEVLHHAISLPNRQAAQAYLEDEERMKDLGQYGFVLQLATRALLSKTGWLALQDILDRLFGKPRQAIIADLALDMDEAPIIVFGTAQKEETEKG